MQAGGAHKPNGWDFDDGLGLRFTEEWRDRYVPGYYHPWAGECYLVYHDFCLAAQRRPAGPGGFVLCFTLRLTF